MFGYFLTLIFVWIVLIALIKLFKLQILPKKRRAIFVLIYTLVFVVPGFFVDVTALKLGWYVFPASTLYLWRTPVGVPVEEILFFATAPYIILTVWKLIQKFA